MSREGCLVTTILTAPCPCDGCFYQPRCANGLACVAFLKYQCGSEKRVWEVQKRTPNAKLYRSIFATAN